MRIKNLEHPNLAHLARNLARLVELDAPQLLIVMQLNFVLHAASRIYEHALLARYGIEVVP